MTKFSLKRPKFTIVMMILFLIFGGVSLTNLPMQLFPDINPPVAAVLTSYDGASPEEVEEKVTMPLEAQLSTTSGLNKISSTSMEGFALIILEFDWSTVIDDVELDIINTVRQVPMPDGANEPSFLKFDPSMMPTAMLAITSDKDLADFQDEALELQQELMKIIGVASVNEAGTITERVQIDLDQDELVEANLTQDNVVSAIQSHQVSLPGGTVKKDDYSLTTRVISEITTVEQLEELVIGVDAGDGSNILLADIAEVTLDSEEQSALTRANQEAAIQFTIMKESDANTVGVSNAVSERLDELLQQSKYEDLHVVTIYDEGEYISLAIDSVTNALIIGGALAMLVLFLFLRNLKTPLIIGIAIPFSIIVTFAFMYFAGIGLNLMSLGGLALGIGMLVDTRSS